MQDQNVFVGKKKVKAMAIGSWAISLLMIISTVAYAHQRDYVWTEVYRTLPKGGIEIESWTSFEVPDINRSNENSIEYQFELEYGVTDRLTIAHYQRWETDNVVGDDDTTNYTGFKFEAKYRFFDKGKFWVDPLIYLEWVTNPHNDDNPNKIEAKIVLSKDIGKFNITYNQILESELGSGGRTEQNFELGMNYLVFSTFKAGLEFGGNYWHPSDNRNQISLGPTFSYEWKYFWIASGLRWGLNRASDDFEARIIVGVPF
ncbi:MAG TPA: hypothetical protein VD913_03735 [bacterium]|nr:hypothetical protein [bacterium]